MKFLFLLVSLFTMNAHAYLYQDHSRVYVADIECLDSVPSEIECQRIQNNLMMCRSEFDAIMKNGGVKTLNLTHYEKIAVDSKLFRPITDSINEFTAKFESKRHVKERIKEIGQISKCE